MKRYKYNEWDFEWIDKYHPGGFDTRFYIDDNGYPITGILEGFYGFTSDTTDERNCQYVENGKRKNLEE